MLEENTNAMTAAEADEDAIIATLSDYLDGALSSTGRHEVEQRLARDPTWQRVHGELIETRKALSGLQKARTPDRFAEQVTETIHKRSAGRFFGRKTFGDRVPFSALLVVALVGLIVIAYVLWSSETGSLKVDTRDPKQPGSASIAPKP
jgi:anti-sigma factor RsiW